MSRQPALCVLLVAAAGCTQERAAVPGAPDTAAARAEARAVRPGARAPGAPFTLDPARLHVGDTVRGMRVAALDVQRAFADSLWVGWIELTGPLVLSGVYQPHFDAEVPVPCLHVPADSAHLVPHFQPDRETSPRRKAWFCFANPDAARAQLGDPAAPRAVKVRLARYRALRQFTDAWDEATLDSVLDRGAARPRTLLLP